MNFKMPSLNIWKKCLLVLTIAHLIADFTLAQPNHEIDSIVYLLKTAELDTNKVKMLNDLSYLIMQTSDYIKAKTYSDEAMALAQKLKYRTGEAHAYNVAGSICESLGDFQASLDNHHSCLRIYEELGNKIGIANASNRIGLVYWHKGQYLDALKSYFTSLKIFEELRNKIGLAKTYNNIGIIYDLQGNPLDAVKNYENALKIAEELHYEYGIAVCRTNIGIINNGQGDYNSALENHMAALTIWKKIGEKSGMLNSYINIGWVHANQKNHALALYNYQLALDIALEIGAKYDAASAHALVGGSYTYLKEYTNAEHHLLAGLSLAKEVGAKAEIQKAYDGLSKLKMQMGNTEDAFSYYRLYIAYKDSLYNETSNKQIAEIKEQYESEKKNKEILILTNEKQTLETDKQLSVLLLRTKQDSLNIVQSEKEKVQLENEKFHTLNLFNKQQLELLGNEKRLRELQDEKNKAEAGKTQEQLAVLNKEKKIQELELKKEKLTKNYFIAGLGVFLVLSFFIYRNYQTRQEVKLLTIRNKIAIDLHDDVGSTLSSISMFSQMAQAQSKEHIPALETIGESSRKMLDAMADIVWSIKPENDLFEKVIMHMREFAYQLLGTKQIEFEFDADDDISKINLPMETRKNLYLIFKEATNNMAKYSKANNAKFALKGENNKLTMVISDDGKGFDTTNDSRGNGLENMKRRAVEIGAKLLIDSTPGIGTTIKLELAV